MQQFQFSNVGYIIDDVPVDLLTILHKKSNELKNNFLQGEEYNQNLAGNIQHEYNLKDLIPEFTPYIIELGKFYKQNFPYNPRFISGSNIVLKDFWINFQKKYEFNPIHNHTGLFSFVIWLDIPYDIEQEIKLGPGNKSNNNLAGHFEFTYVNSLGDITTMPIPADKKFNGKICMFPSGMFHTVYPFYTSDDYRITISGNIKFSDQM
jgi:hypothetical protein